MRLCADAGVSLTRCSQDWFFPFGNKLLFLLVVYGDLSCREEDWDIWVG